MPILLVTLKRQDLFGKKTQAMFLDSIGKSFISICTYKAVARIEPGDK